MSYPCLKCGIHLLLLLSKCRETAKLFVFFSPAGITLCSVFVQHRHGWVQDGAAQAIEYTKQCFSPYSPAVCPAAVIPFCLKNASWVAG